MAINFIYNSKNNLKYKALFSYLFLVISLTNIQAEALSRTKILMNTFVTITLPKEFRQFSEPTFHIIKTVEDSLSSFKNSSPIYKLNKNKRAKLDMYSYEALQLSSLYYTKTDGYFNIAIGSITQELYHFGEEETLPNNKQLHKSNTEIIGLSFDNKRASLVKEMSIDLGGMGKGYAVDKAIQYLQNKKVPSAIVAASGDIRCLSSCKMAIFNPFTEKALAEFRTKHQETGISTSGNYEHFVKNVKNNHLINPKTKHSQQNFISITLISHLPSSDLDAYATAASVMPKKQAFKFLRSIDIAFIVLDTRKHLSISKNIKKFVDNLIINDTFKKYPKKIKHQ